MIASVKCLPVIAVALLAIAPAFAQEKTAAPVTNAAASLDDLADFVSGYVDPDVVGLLAQLDDDRVSTLFSQLQAAIDGTNIYQLGVLRQTATQVIPILNKYEETAALGDWLQTQLDYMQAAAELQAGAHSAPPSAEMERRVWMGRLSHRPWPASARMYVTELKPDFAAEGVPPQLVWLGEVESSFKPNARSPAGAAGMFQLMPQTARDEQLSLWPRDERLQPDKSARAAARYLRALHDHYGDWELALAAYNCGEGRVDKLLKQENAHTFEAIAQRLPAETQMYVPKFEATLLEREGRGL
jgi:membrane-bound lytic murein transglycosylase D